MVLAVDVGNSNIVMGGYQNGKIMFLTRLSTNHKLEADQYALQIKGILSLYGAENIKLEKVVMASVVPGLTSVIVRAFRHFCDVPPHVISLKDAGCINICIDNPRELGTDILASAISVAQKSPLPAVIIDMGTATKITALDQNCNLLGVAISPGLYISLSALVKGTNTLSGIPVEAPDAAIGKNTAESMKSGLVFGTAAMLDGMIDRFAEEMGGLSTIIATGGVAHVVAPHCKHKVEICDTLLLDGLYSIVAGG